MKKSIIGLGALALVFAGAAWGYHKDTTVTHVTGKVYGFTNIGVNHKQHMDLVDIVPDNSKTFQLKRYFINDGLKHVFSMDDLEKCYDFGVGKSVTTPFIGYHGNSSSARGVILSAQPMECKPAK